MRIVLARVYEIDAVWPFLREGFQRSYERSDYMPLTSGELWQMCRSGNAFLILVMDGDAIMAGSCWRFERRETDLAFKCLALTGTGMKHWLGDLFAYAKLMAIENGAQVFVTSGRKGWERIFPQATKNGEWLEMVI